MPGWHDEQEAREARVWNLLASAVILTMLLIIAGFVLIVATAPAVPR